MSTKYKLNSSYYSYVQSSIQETIKPLYDLAIKIISKPKVNQKDISQLKGWPRSLNEFNEGPYNNCIRCIVTVGLETPVEAINTLVQLTKGNSSDTNSLYHKLRTYFEVDANNDYQSTLFDLLLFSIFVDSVSQFTPSLDKLERNHTEISDNDRNFMIPCENFSLPAPSKKSDFVFQNFFEPLSLELYAQSAVIVAYYSKNQIETAQMTFSNSIQNDQSTNFFGKFAQYRFLIYPDNKALTFLEESIIPILEKNTKLQSNVNYKFVYKFVKNLILQIPAQNTDKISQLTSKLMKCFSDNQQKTIINALLVARNNSTDLAAIQAFFKNAKCYPKTQLKAFLYILRGPHFYAPNQFWGYGDINNPYSLSEEKKLIFDLPETKELSFYTIFKTICTDANPKVLTRILFNLFQRNSPDDNLSYLYSFVNLITERNHEYLACSFFNALTLYLDPSAEITDSASIKQKIYGFIAEQVRRRRDIDELNTKSSLMRIVSDETCPSFIKPQDNIAPNTSLTGAFKRIEEACAIVNKSINLNDQSAEKDPIPFTVPQTPQYQEQINPSRLDKLLSNIYLIALFYQTIHQDSTLTYEDFYPIVRMAIHTNSDLSHFALYALQVFYIQKPQTVLPILIAINKVMKESTIGLEVAFTLLNLVNQLISLPVLVVDDGNRETFGAWFTELEAILLAHLASPYPVVRDVTLIVMGRLDDVCSRFEVPMTIASLLRVFDTTITQRVAFRCSSNKTFQSLDKIDFGTICRSSNYIIYSMYLVEYAQCLCRNSLKCVLDQFLELNLVSKINFEYDFKKISQEEAIWRTLPLISLTQRLVPVQMSTYEKLAGQYYDLLPSTCSLHAYEIQKDLYTCTNNDYITERNQFWNKNTEILVTKMLKETNNSIYYYHILSSVANASSIELLPAFLNSFLKTILSNLKAPLLFALSGIIRSSLLSPDFVLVPASHLLTNDTINNIFKWFHSIQVDGKDLIHMAADSNVSIRSIPLNYLSCISAISDSFMCITNIGNYGAIRSYVQTPWLYDDNMWSFEHRQKSFSVLFALMNNEDISEKVLTSLLSFINSVPFYTEDQTFPIVEDHYQLFIKLEKENKDLRVLYPVLRHHPFLLSEYLKKSINSPIEKGFYFFRAYCDYFIYNYGGVNVDELKQDDLNANLQVVDLAGDLIVTALIFIGSPNGQCRKCAFDLLRRILPILCTFNQKDDIQTASIINSYLDEHRGELSVYSIAPTQQQCMELASKIAQTMPFIIERVFHSFFTYFTAFENQTFINITQSFLPLILNIIIPFAAQLRFGENVSVYPDNFHNPTATSPLQFIKDFIKFYPCVLRDDHPLYVKVFEAIMTNEKNIQPLATMLVMNSNEFESNELDATCTILLYLIQKQPTLILSLLTQRLAFGHYFCNNWLSGTLLTEKPFKVRNWVHLSLRVLGEVALANFSLLLPYIHIILNYCLLSYNNLIVSQKDNAQVTYSYTRHLLQAIISHYTSDVILPDKMPISFDSKQATDLIPVKSIISVFNKHLKQHSPSAIRAWKIESLQWATSCSHLPFACNAAVIYSLLECNYLPKDPEKIILALNIVLEYYKTLGDKLQNVDSYACGSFQMLLSITKRAILENKLNEVAPAIELASKACEIDLADQKLGELALKILTTVVSKQPYEPLPIQPQQLHQPLVRVAKMLSLEFNNPDLSKFLTYIFVNLTNMKDMHENRYIALGLLLPVIYATFSAFTANEQFSAFVENELIIWVRHYITLLSNTGVDDTFDRLFKALYDILSDNPDETFTPSEFLDRLSTLIWNSYPAAISHINEFYSILLSESINNKSAPNDEVREAVYEVAHSLLKLIPEEQKYQLQSFTNLLQYAIYDNSHSARLLIKMHVIKQGPQEAIENPINKYGPKQIHKNLDNNFINKLSYPAIFRTISEEKIVNFMEMKEARVMMLIDTRQPEAVHFENQRNALSNIEARPYAKQIEFWDNVTHAEFETVEPKPLPAPTAFDFFAHSKASDPVKATSAQLYAHKNIFDPQCFILRDEEFDDFEKRLNFE